MSEQIPQNIPASEEFKGVGEQLVDENELISLEEERQKVEGMIERGGITRGDEVRIHYLDLTDPGTLLNAKGYFDILTDTDTGNSMLFYSEEPVGSDTQHMHGMEFKSIESIEKI
ncbi:MAG: hypothetical protein UV68_C0061G0005 [Candidatus Collierbacteria bacterium GW2011_GWC2_43_12]|uniref:Uncharacterized protein n=1 Tax=Candidatus Collierbacteria bacterium GW2011_GWC2_43_12 TaxID=1618390 RepID=A0A0G1D1E9_9BACT|nr:MAG: hypothetical protein UV68_C0061G0005 [Candidatus Collierbacteria bacterium GW2011_GWC2_43_12]KKU73260.1 MAG: hypothetical protein UX96_C0007G0057 [Candidatus Wolfebacteria bacterium GW2011_GWB1_47_243]